MNTKILTLVGYGATWLITTIFFTIRNKKTKSLAVKKLTELNEDNTKKEKLVTIAKIVQKIPEWITKAENLIGAGNGTAKLNQVLSEIKLECVINAINFSEYEKQFTEEIEAILSTPQKKEEERGETENG